MPSPRKQVGLPLALVERVDVAAEAAGTSRTAYVERAVEAALAGGLPTETPPIVADAEKAPVRPAVSSKRYARPAYPKARKR